ncbi:hypothetical protein [Streptomyces sp. NPDC091371]|uniref:hypothetical protein n=1 Tax=Streptomyces sp. NPDC091371 TaxID=3155303 RepID=UPI0034298850
MLRGTTFGRKWRKARDAADTCAKLKDLMVRVGQSSERAQLIYQHSTKEHQRRLADDIDANVRSRRMSPDRGSGAGAEATIHGIVPPLAAPGGAARRR